MDELQDLLEDNGLWEVPEDKLEEIVQLELEEHLDNLGYIDIDQNDDERLVDWDLIIKGIATFRKEYREHFKFFSDHPRIFKYTFPLSVVTQAEEDELTEEELDFMAQLCSLEGEFALHQFSESEILLNKILKRALGYRLSIFGLRLKGHFRSSSDRRPSLADLGKWARVNAFEEQIKLVGDVHLLCRTLIDQDDYPDSEYCHIVYVEEKGLPIKDEGDISERRERFKGRFVLLPEKAAQLYDQRRKRDELSSVVQDPLNKLMARIVQVKLWLLGTYQGKLDNDIGPISVEAIQDLIDFLLELQQKVTGREVSEKDKAIKMSDIIVRPPRPVFPRGRFWALNASFLLRHVFPILIDKYTGGSLENASRNDREKVEEEEVVEDGESVKKDKHDQDKNITVAGEIGDLTNELAAKGSDDEEVYKELNTQIEGANTALKKRRRNVRTRGGRDFFLSIKKFFRSIINTIAQGIDLIIKAIKKLFQWIKNGIQVLLREIKKVFVLLRKSIQFVFGKKIIRSRNKNTFLVTDYDFDFDSITEAVGKKGLPHRMHIRQNLDILLALQQTTSFVGMVLFFAVQIGSPGFGWIKLGIKLINFLKKDKFKFQRFSFPTFPDIRV